MARCALNHSLRLLVAGYTQTHSNTVKISKMPYIATLVSEHAIGQAVTHKAD